jgi:ATP-dependent Clp protease ATP-binding subunit ClpA
LTFERFTEEARAMVVDAQTEARDLRHHHIGTEHLLLGLLRQHESGAARTLTACGVDLPRARARVMAHVHAGHEEVTGQMPFTPRAKKTLELALRESLSAGSNTVASEHILLGLLREGEGVGTQVLRELEVDIAGLRTAVLATLPPPGEVVREAQRRGPPRPRAEVGFVLEPSAEVRRLLMSAGARALDDGRTEIEVRDVEEALRRERPPEAAAG